MTCRIMIFLLLGVFSINLTNANTIFNQVPFLNVILASGDHISSTYGFNGHKIIFCYTNSFPLVEGEICWPYHGKQSGSIPIYLKTQAGVTGEYADESGTLFITNTTSNTVVMNCDYAF